MYLNYIKDDDNIESIHDGIQFTLNKIKEIIKCGDLEITKENIKYIFYQIALEVVSILLKLKGVKCETVDNFLKKLEKIGKCMSNQVIDSAAIAEMKASEASEEAESAQEAEDPDYIVPEEAEQYMEISPAPGSSAPASASPAKSGGRKTRKHKKRKTQKRKVIKKRKI
jgi:hypothetical protein